MIVYLASILQKKIDLINIYTLRQAYILSELTNVVYIPFENDPCRVLTKERKVINYDRWFCITDLMQKQVVV